MINIVIPMAGLGSRFRNAGFDTPKPLIPIHGIPMIRLVIDNVRPKNMHRFIFICQREHIQNYELMEKLKNWAPNCEVLAIDRLTEGAACTVLTARHLIDSDQPLMIVNSDQYISVSIDDYIEAADNLDGIIMTMYANDPKWSFVEIGNDQLVRRVVEKEVISEHATVGIYYFISGHQFVSAADEMINKNIRVNNEFYVAPVYNELIRSGARIGMHSVERNGGFMFGLGIPSDLNSFASLSVSLEAVRKVGE